MDLEDSMDDAESPDVDLTWPPERVKEFCENTRTWALSIPNEWTAANIESLYRRHAAVADPYVYVISEIADDSRTPIHVLVEIKDRFVHLIPVASALALNPNTPLEFVQELARHSDEAVRAHAKQALHRRKAP